MNNTERNHKMFKNAMIYRCTARPAIDRMLHGAEQKQFVPCTPTQPVSYGFVPVRGIDNGALVEWSDGRTILLRVRIETRTVPAATVKKEVERRCRVIADQTGRKPGKKQRIEIKEDVFLALLPQAFSKFTDVMVWVERMGEFIVIDTTSASRADDVITLLVSMCEGWVISTVRTTLAPRALMTGWLVDGGPDYDEFGFGRDASLKATDEVPSTIVYGSTELDIDEIKAHIRSGRFSATKLGLGWKGRVSFTLTEGLALQKIEMLDAALLGATQTEAVDAFDADVAIVTGELRPLIADLIAACDGLAEETTA